MDTALAAAEAAVEATLRSCQAVAEEILASRAGALVALRDALLERETVSGEELEALLAAHGGGGGGAR